MSMSTSRIHDGGSITGNATLKKDIERKANLYDADNAAYEKQSLAGEAFNAGQNEGFRKGYEDFAQRLAASNQYTPMYEGSPEALEMDANMARGANYGLLDEVERQMSAQPVQGEYEEQASQAENELIEDAQTSAFATAQEMGDTSEENMNKLLIEELNIRGIQ